MALFIDTTLQQTYSVHSSHLPDSLLLSTVASLSNELHYYNVNLVHGERRFYNH